MPEHKPIPPWAIFLGFLALISPVGLVLAFVLGPFALIVLVFFFGTASVAFWAKRAGTNLFTKLTSPDEYEEIKARDGDPFFESLGFFGTHPTQTEDQSDD